MKINKKYIGIALMLLTVEIVIALFVRDAFIRPYFGDVLVIFLLYFFVKGLAGKKLRHLPFYLFVFATAVEVSQYYKIIQRLNLQSNKLIGIVAGSRFDVKDILCYLLACVILYAWEKTRV